MKSPTQNNDLNSQKRHGRFWRSARNFDMVLFAILGSLMFCSKLLMEALPNIHLLGMLTMVYTLVFRSKALAPIYCYVLLVGVYGGFSTWWVPHLYLWLILWGVTMLIPRRMPRAVCCVVYPVICALYGFAYGTLYAPFQALVDGLGWEGMLIWIANGLRFDILHGCGNFIFGFFILPLSELLSRLYQKYSRR